MHASTVLDRFADAATMVTGKRGYDRVRNTEIGLMDFKCVCVRCAVSHLAHSDRCLQYTCRLSTLYRLKYFEEVFTSQHWMVRIYRVLPEGQRATKLRNPHRVKVAKKGKKGGKRA